MNKAHHFLGIIAFSCFATMLFAQSSAQKQIVDSEANTLEPKVIEWRRHFHQYPELSNREEKTAKYIADHLTSLGLEVKTGIAFHGVVGVLRTGKPGPVIGLRADIDALPVVERVDLHFASKVRTDYAGQNVGVMHACGHDTHTAMLMGAASILTKMKNQLVGTIVFVFQPAEEGAPPGEKGGASLMVEQGLITEYKLEVMFGIHINSLTEVGKIRYKPEGTMAASDQLFIKVKGKQTHGSQPWAGVDPVVASAQIINGLQSIVSRQVDLTQEAAVVTIAKIHGGVRGNIIPEEVEMEGTIRTLDGAMQDIIHDKIKLTATKIAESFGATAEVKIIKANPITYNDAKLTAKMLPVLEMVAGGENNVLLSKAVTGAEDFSYYAKKIPSLFIFLGGMPKGKVAVEMAPHHTPDFFIDESGMKLGVRTYCYLAMGYK